MVKSSILLGCALGLFAAALPVDECSTPNTNSGAATTSLTADTLIAIDPKTASCDGATFPAECADASRAAASISKSFEKYSIASPGEQAALIALMLYESGSFKYNKNHYPEPGRPGQGTRNMQMPQFNIDYAASLFGSAAVQSAGSLDGVLELVSKDEESFGSAAWFLSTKCSADVRTGLADATPEGWAAYLTQCIGTTDTPDRDTIWKAAVQALGSGN
ncbi:hypothetical protein BU26DRAFT_209565 [Trematosphaeria pertusa]|uniref:Uncharacterized protein n=1 Tax=Trematosphaeria pertusa TaxID=390896 RepID=A0A6A6ITC8_9PLEO|nr:uncharacterized protein BU26DRAFT_209565 [Trematosphaeria pertusa]KAF2252793.1 hypothetical protein BU26DRAFT_209565 [Trematosphaeria pertusa]